MLEHLAFLQGNASGHFEAQNHFWKHMFSQAHSIQSWWLNIALLGRVSHAVIWNEANKLVYTV